MPTKVKLNKNARAWVRALRSGKYKQTKNVLTRVDLNTGEIIGNCCIGVLCELGAKAGVIKEVTIIDGEISYDGDTNVAPKSVRDWSGLKVANGFYGKGAKLSALTQLNDNGKSFKQIARIIEQKAKELFV